MVRLTRPGWTNMSALVPYFNGSWWLSATATGEAASAAAWGDSSTTSGLPALVAWRAWAWDWAYCLQDWVEHSTEWVHDISEQVVSGNFSSVWDVFGPESRDFVTKLELTDFQWKLIWEFSLILLGNTVLVILAWRIYGPRIIHRFFSPGGRKVLQDLRLSMSELKLPKEHDFKKMPNPIKQFFEKKKAEAKFKMAGPGQKLGDTSGEAARRAQALERFQNDPQAVAGPSRPKTVSAAQQQAAQAALSRLDSSQSTDFSKKRSQAVIRAQAMKELEKEKKIDDEVKKLRETYSEKPVVELEGPSTLVCSGVYFHCPLIGPEVLPKAEMKQKIKDFLYQQLEDEKALTACLIIHTMAKDDEKAKNCVDTLCKYIDNILKDPSEEKFRKIRKTNKVYQEKVAPIEGHDLFLDAAGFETMTIDDQEFWVFSSERVNDEQLETLSLLKDALLSSEPIRAELDRGLRVLMPAQAARKFTLPPDFFSVGVDEIRKEQQALTENLEREGMLRTKAMREREQQRERRKYRYSLIRVRFPNGMVIQGTFSVYEKYRAIHDFVAECLEHPLPFVLYEAGSGGHRLEQGDYDKTLMDLELIPSSLMTFAWHPEVAEEVKAQIGENATYLKVESGFVRRVRVLFILGLGPSEVSSARLPGSISLQSDDGLVGDEDVQIWVMDPLGVRRVSNNLRDQDSSFVDSLGENVDPIFKLDTLPMAIGPSLATRKVISGTIPRSKKPQSVPFLDRNGLRGGGGIVSEFSVGLDTGLDRAEVEGSKNGPEWTNTKGRESLGLMERQGYEDFAQGSQDVNSAGNKRELMRETRASLARVLNHDKKFESLACSTLECLEHEFSKLRFDKVLPCVNTEIPSRPDWLKVQF
ncbi:hypothetical protein TCAL_08029 [Tigriopus californicus]|uniref:UBX domain-containing protein n=1 Tax=Tigriopus californicus TaxID=6832 RepID=A0A553NPX4_TIGCA|nr:hypothetical protein TCAL_08029 [Tigriopus californicus]